MRAPKLESTFKQLPEGLYTARLYSIVEIGTETGDYLGEPKSNKKIRFLFELPTELNKFKEGDEEKPYVVARDFTFSMHPKSNLRSFIENWIGKFKSDEVAYDFDVDALMGKTGFANIYHKMSKDGSGKSFLAISGMVPLPKGTVVPEPINTPFTLYYENWDQAAFDIQPDWIKNRMAETPEYKKMMGEDIEDIELEDVPFQG